MKCEIDGCANETVDGYRKCAVCGKHICWSHVIRVAVTVHTSTGVTYTEPMYLCPQHLSESLLTILLSKYKATPQSLNLYNILAILSGFGVRPVVAGSLLTEDIQEGTGDA